MYHGAVDSDSHTGSLSTTGSLSMSAREERLRGYRSAELQDLQELLADRLLTEDLYRAEVKYVLGQDPHSDTDHAEAEASWDRAGIPAQPIPGQRSPAKRAPAPRMKRTAFEKGDSNRCRNVYEQILRAEIPAHTLDAQKKNKHVSVGRCRMLAINYRVALPPYELLSRVAFVEPGVPRADWRVPTDCKRFLKKLPEEGLCTNSCKTCDVPRTLQSICGTAADAAAGRVGHAASPSSRVASMEDAPSSPEDDRW